jgi:protein SCO1
MVYWAQRIVSTRLTALLFFNILILVSGCAKREEALPFYNTPDFTPIFLEDLADVEERVPHRINTFQFSDQHGNAISDQSIVGKVHVANFVFTSCISICPKMTANLKIVSDRFENDSSVVFLSYSVTPWIDSAQVLKQYAIDKQITNKNWHLLTGQTGKIYDLARKSYFAEEDLGYTKDSTEFLHTEHFILVDQNKRIRGIYNGTLQLEMEDLIKDIDRLKMSTF